MSEPFFGVFRFLKASSMKPIRWLYVTPSPVASGAVDAVRTVWLVRAQ